MNSPVNEKGELVFALMNQWGAFNGEAISVNDIKINLPKWLSIVPNDESCPFVQEASNNKNNVYVMNKNIIPPEYNLTTVRSFVCQLNTENIESDSGELSAFVVITASYTYRISSFYDLYVRDIDEKDQASADSLNSEINSNGETKYNGPAASGSFDCNNKAANQPDYMKNYISVYENGRLSSQIKEGLENAIISYKPDWLDEQQTRALLLAIMIAESSLGENEKTWNSEGIPYHIAGCTCCAQPYNVQADIVCAAERIKSYVQPGSYCAEYVNADTDAKLKCAIKTYNNRNADDSAYYNPVRNYMYYWNSYFCGVRA